MCCNVQVPIVNISAAVVTQLLCCLFVFGHIGNIAVQLYKRNYLAYHGGLNPWLIEKPWFDRSMPPGDFEITLEIILVCLFDNNYIRNVFVS